MLMCSSANSSGCYKPDELLTAFRRFIILTAQSAHKHIALYEHMST